MDSRPRLRWDAVAVGAIVDQGGSIIMAFMVMWVSGVLSLVETGGRSQRHPDADAAGQLVYEILSIAFVALGGLVAARIAKTRMIAHGCAVGVVSLIGAHILGLLIGADFGDAPRAIFFAALTLGAGPVGGAFALLFGAPPRDRQPAAAPAPAPPPASGSGRWVDLSGARDQPPRY